MTRYSDQFSGKKVCNLCFADHCHVWNELYSVQPGFNRRASGGLTATDPTTS